MIAEGSIDKLIAWLAEMGLNGATEDDAGDTASASVPSTPVCRSPARW